MTPKYYSYTIWMEISTQAKGKKIITRVRQYAHLSEADMYSVALEKKFKVVELKKLVKHLTKVFTSIKCNGVEIVKYAFHTPRVYWALDDSQQPIRVRPGMQPGK